MAQERKDTTNRRCRARRQRGSAMLEMALCSTLFLMIFFGLFELGRAVWTYNTVAHAARQGARYASVHGEYQPASDEEILNQVKAQAPGLDKSIIKATTTWIPDRSFGSLVQVDVQYELPLIVSPLVLKNTKMSLGATGNSIVTQ